MSDMITFTGKKFDPLYMKENDVSLMDIAHALSLICRGGGHIKHFYTVAQHCINCANEAEARGLSDRICLACLLYDASNAYISDVIHPIKAHLQQYHEIEEYIREIIFGKFNLLDFTDEENKYRKQINDAVSFNGFSILLPAEAKQVPPTLFSTPDFSEKDHRKIEMEYMKQVNKYLVRLQTTLKGDT